MVRLPQSGNFHSREASLQSGESCHEVACDGFHLSISMLEGWTAWHEKRTGRSHWTNLPFSIREVAFKVVPE